MKKHYHIATACPIPDVAKAIDAIIDKELSPKMTFNGTFGVFFLGMAALHFIFFTDPMGTSRFATIAPWAILAFSVITVIFMMRQGSKNVKIMCECLHNCFSTYLEDPVHRSLDRLVLDYHGCLRTLKQLELEFKYHSAYNKYHDREEQWLEHVNKFWPTVITTQLWSDERGAKLKAYGLYPFYDIWENSSQSLRLLYEQHLTIDELRQFLILKRDLVAKFSHEPNEARLAQAGIELTLHLTVAKDEIMEEMQEIDELIEELCQERNTLYYNFKQAYLKLGKDFDLVLPPF